MTYCKHDLGGQDTFLCIDYFRQAGFGRGKIQNQSGTPAVDTDNAFAAALRKAGEVF